MKKFTNIVVLIFLFTFSSATEQNSNQPTLHMIIVGETNGGNIGTLYDFPKMQSEAKRIGKMSGLKIEIHAYEKQNISAEFLASFLKNIICGPDDVIWFYYTGHGFNASQGMANFPGFVLSNTNFSQEWVHKILEGKGARLTISMYDCCNVEAENFDFEGSVLLDGNERNYIALFGESSGSIKVASNEAGYKKYSFGNPDTGGLFSVAFRQALDELIQVNYEDCTWPKVLERTYELTQKYAKELKVEQSPYFEIEVLRYH